jgi:hypothetical protein
MKTIAQRVQSFGADIAALEADRAALSLDILAEVRKRRNPVAQWEWVMEHVAHPLAKVMSAKCDVKVEASIGNRGAPVFKVGDARHEPTRNAFRLLVGQAGLVAKVGSQNKRDKTEKVAPRKTKRVTDLLVMFHDLNAAERAAFFAAAKRD